jgi:hypothetical protein
MSASVLPHDNIIHITYSTSGPVVMQITLTVQES